MTNFRIVETDEGFIVCWSFEESDDYPITAWPYPTRAEAEAFVVGYEIGSFENK